MKNHELLLPDLFEGIYIVDRKRKIIFWNKAAELITGYTEEEVKNSYCFNNILRHITEDGTELCKGGCPLHDSILTGNVNNGEVFLHHKQGHKVPVSVKTFPMIDDEGNISGAIEAFTDKRGITEALDENLRLKEMLAFDELTQVFNRRHLNLLLDTKKYEADTLKSTFGVLFFDIDNFKSINDKFGHNVGDEVLKLLSKTINYNIRTEDVFGRWGGEEFIAIIKISSKEKLLKIAEKLRILVSKSEYKENDININITVSIGGSMYQENETIESIVERADKNMYFAKQNGKNQVKI